MKLALFTFLAVAVCAANAGPTSRIIGGVNALPAEFPQICMIQWVFLGTQNNVCACTILDGTHVITAAHCITEAPTTGRLEVIGGILDTTVVAAERQRLGVLSTHIHPQFSAGENQDRRNDVAILRLQSPFGWNSWIQPARLPALNAVPSGVTMIAGWGQTGTGILPPSATHLQKIQAPVVAFAECATSLFTNFGFTLREEFMCTGPLTGGIGVCNGDAGGPVLQNGVLLGVISTTMTPCAAVGSASIHSNVAHHISWIRDFVREQN